MKFWEAGNINYNPIFLAAHGFFPRFMKYTGMHFVSVSSYVLALALSGWQEQLAKLSSIYSSWLGMKMFKFH